MTDGLPAPYSLKRRLLIVLLAAVLLVWLATAVYSYFDARHEVDELLDAHLAQSASLIVAQVGHELEGIEVGHAPQLHRRSRRVAFQIWEGGSALRLHSVNAPETRLSNREEGFSNTRLEGKGWRVFSTWDDRHRFLVQVGERDAIRREIAAGVARSLLVPLIFALPALGLFVWISIVRALRPVSVLGRTVEARAPDDVAPLESAGTPAEVVPLVRSLNALFARVANLIERERRFTADAAHELRTPLAALRAHAQVAHDATRDDERSRALDQVISGCDRATRLVEQLLTLARIEPEQRLHPSGRCDLRALAQRAVAELAPAALSKNIDIELAGTGAAEIACNQGLVSVLLRNLIDNAIRYSPRESRVCVAVDGAAGGTSVSVTDEGPGIAPEERSKVGRRFYRILGTGESGSGLGLSIVRRIAEIHDATVSLENGAAGKGLRVSVVFKHASGTTTDASISHRDTVRDVDDPEHPHTWSL
jgi:two-component system sensor histidine kinase QseC